MSAESDGEAHGRGVVSKSKHTAGQLGELLLPLKRGDRDWKLGAFVLHSPTNK